MNYKYLFCFLLFCTHQAFADSGHEMCSKTLRAPLDVISSGLSRDLSQQRVYSFEQTGIDAAGLKKLQPKWSFVFSDAIHPRSTAAISQQAVFIGSQDGRVYALDKQRACVYWSFKANAEVRSAVSVAQLGERWQLFFADLGGEAYAVDALTGTLIWQRSVDSNEKAIVTGSPVYYQGSLYVPVSSMEVADAVNPLFSCCKFRGSLLALDALTGKTKWRFYTIDEEAQVIGRNGLGVQQFGPSGAAIWSPPTIDVKNQRIYIGTGQNYQSPATDMSDAIIALDLKTGKKLWHRQTFKNDTWNSACTAGLLGLNCPKEQGMDYDFGAPPIFVTLNDGRDVVIAGQKSGWVYAMDAGSGDIVWQKHIGRGGILGGIHWGMAADSSYVYVPVADTDVFILDNTPGKPRSGLYKLDITTGETLWYSEAFFSCKRFSICKHGLSAAITVIPGAVLAGGLDGVLRAYSTDTGEVVWSFDSSQKTQGINGISGKGGTLDAAPVVVADGQLFFNSGYGGFFSVGSKAGNVFWVLDSEK